MPKTSIKPLLSKSTFVRGTKCLKSLHLYKHHYDLRDEVSTAQQAIFDQGHLVGQLAWQLFPAGTDCSVDPAYDYQSSVSKTQSALAAGAKVLYEPGFIYNNVFAAIDILVIRKGGWYIYEVKSSTEVKDYHYMDAAIQYYILKGLGHPVKAVHVVTINNEYVRHGDIEPKKLFTINDVTRDAVELQLFVGEQLPVLFNVLASTTTPEMEIGPQCSKYYGCDFQGHCWKMFDGVEYPVYDIKRLSEGKLFDLVRQGILCQTQVPVTYPLSDHQKIQVHATRTQTSPDPDLPKLREFLDTIQPPIAFLDFETIATAIPLFDNVRPYQQVPFQYSIHLIESEEWGAENGQQLDGYLPLATRYSLAEHFEFLGDGKTDPRKDLLESMLPLLKSSKTIICYNVPFEQGRLEDLALLFPEHADEIHEIISKLVDLIVPFRSKWVYHHAMNGSASIKNVLPALLPHMSYDDLEIKEGGSASQAYLNLFEESDEQVIRQTRSALLEYCKMDTWAMVGLWGWMRKRAEE